MLERDAARRLGGVIGRDDVYWCGECRGSPNKTSFLAALCKNLEGHPFALRLSVVKGFRKRELSAWAAKFLDPDSIVVSDGLACFRAIAEVGIEHQPLVTGGAAASVELADFT